MTDTNEMIVDMKLKRIEICNLLLSCTAAWSTAREGGDSGKHWEDLHQKLQGILDDFDSKQG